MRVLGRVLLGTLAIVFAMAFLARLVSRPRRRHRHVHATSIPPRSVQPAARRSSQHLRSTTFLAALPGGSGWGRLVVPPSSRSRTLRRDGRRAARGMDDLPGGREESIGKQSPRDPPILLLDAPSPKDGALEDCCTARFPT